MPSPIPDDPQPGDSLDALIRAARRAPLPPAADRLALGFGARMEARFRAAALETEAVSRLLWRWLTGLGACTAVLVALATAATATRHLPSGAAHTAQTAHEETSIQSAWASYTALPEGWPQL